MDDIPLRDFKSAKSRDENDENFDEELSTFYNSIKSDVPSETQNVTIEQSDSDEDDFNRPLIDKLEENQIEQNSDERDKNYGPATSEELGGLISNDFAETTFDNILENHDQESVDDLPKSEFVVNCGKLSIPKPFITALIFGLAFVFTLFKGFIYRVEYHQISIAQSHLTGRLHDRPFQNGFHIFYPWYSLITFDKTIQTINLVETKIFTTDKLQIKVWFKVYYQINQDTLVEFYRKFGQDNTKLFESVCKSELKNLGQRFSIEFYRTNRSGIRDFLKKNLKRRLENDYLIKFYDLYIDKIKFTKEINHLNLVRVLNDILTEKAEYEKITNVTIAETALKVRYLRNKAKEIIETAKLKAKYLISNIAEYDAQTMLEFVHMDGLNKSLNQLGFSTKSQNETQKTISFCYLSSLINNENVRFIKPNEQIPEQGFSNKFDSLVGILTL